MEKMTKSEFEEWVKNNDDNTFKYEEEGLAKHLMQVKSKFMLICKKCGSTKIHIIGDDGIDFGGMTGYQEGTNVIKCNNCGNADRIYV